MTKRDIAVVTGLAGLTVALGTLVFNRVAGQQLNLTTGLLFLALVVTAIVALAELGLRLGRTSGRTRGNARTVIITSAVLLVGLELFLRFGLGTYTSYLEK